MTYARGHDVSHCNITVNYFSTYFQIPPHLQISQKKQKFKIQIFRVKEII